MPPLLFCQGWHRRSTRRHPRARYVVRHQDDPPEKGRKFCGTHARSYRIYADRHAPSVWVIEEIR